MIVCCLPRQFGCFLDYVLLDYTWHCCLFLFWPLPVWLLKAAFGTQPLFVIRSYVLWSPSCDHDVGLAGDHYHHNARLTCISVPRFKSYSNLHSNGGDCHQCPSTCCIHSSSCSSWSKLIQADQADTKVLKSAMFMAHTHNMTDASSPVPKTARVSPPMTRWLPLVLQSTRWPSTVFQHIKWMQPIHRCTRWAPSVILLTRWQQSVH